MPPSREQSAGETGAAHGLFDLVQAAADSHGHRPALSVTREGRRLSWSHAQLRDAALRAAARLRTLGVVADDRVVLQAESSPEWVVAYFGILAAGAVAIPLDQQTSTARRGEILNYTAARAAILGDQVAEEGLSEGEPSVPLADLCVDGEAPALGDLPFRRGGEDAASILFTSGTTLEPKGVVLAHRAFLANVQSVAHALQPTSRDRLVSVLPLHHAFEFTAGLLAPLSQGASITYLETLSGPAVVETLKRERATVLLGVPRLFELLLAGVHRGVDEAPAPIRGLLRSLWAVSRRQHGRGRHWGRALLFPLHAKFGGRLKLMVSGGAALPPEVQEEFDILGFRLRQGYGLTETGPVLSVNPIKGQLPGSVGLPLPGIEIRIAEPGADGIGEILAQGENLMTGYYRDAEATRAVLRKGWFHTGDLGRIGEDGYLFVTGRLKDLIVTPSGKNVHPDEVEAALKTLEGVREFCVVGAPGRGGSGEDVTLVVVLFKDGDEQREAVRRSVKAAMGALPSHQRIARVVFRRDDLPRTRLQKVQRARVRAELDAPDTRAPSGRRAEAAGHPRAERVLKLLARLTRLEADSLREEQDLALDLGVDSLMTAELLAAAEAVGDDGTPLPEAQDLRSVADLIALARREGGAPQHAVPVRAQADDTPGPLARATAAMVAPLVRAASPLLYRAWLGLEVHGLERIGLFFAQHAPVGRRPGVRPVADPHAHDRRHHRPRVEPGQQVRRTVVLHAVDVQRHKIHTLPVLPQLAEDFRNMFARDLIQNFHTRLQRIFARAQQLFLVPRNMDRLRRQICGSIRG